MNNICLHLISKHFHSPDFRNTANTFLQHKLSKSTIWSDLTIYTHKMLGGHSPHIEHWAAQTELIILALDIMDDLQDGDNLDPPWMKCEPAIAINCSSNLLLAGIAGCHHMPPDPKVLQIISTAHNGQHKDLRNIVSCEEDYLELVNEKSVTLIHLAMRMGFQSLLGNFTPSVEVDLIELAKHIGISAQLQNDLMYLDSTHSRNDLIQRKHTLATLYLLDQSESAFPLLKQYYEEKCELIDLITHQKQLIAFIASSGVHSYISAIQSLHLEQAEHILSRLPLLSPWDMHFKDITIHAYLNRI